MSINKVSDVIVDIIFCILGIIGMILIAVLGTIGFTCLKVCELIQKHTRKFFRLRLF